MESAKLLAVLLIVPMLSTASCVSCADDPKYTVVSPSGRRSVTLAVRNCGATTGFTTVVSVSQKRFGIYPVSKVLFAANGELAGDRWLTLRWASDDELIVRVNNSTELFRQEAPFRGMAVRYEGSPKFGS
jgi:hypothetical protein